MSRRRNQLPLMQIFCEAQRERESSPIELSFKEPDLERPSLCPKPLLEQLDCVSGDESTFLRLSLSVRDCRIRGGPTSKLLPFARAMIHPDLIRMDVDASLRVVGLVGRVQITNFVIFGMGLSLAAIQLTGIAFTVDQSIAHYCKPAPGFSANETVVYVEKDGLEVPDGCYMYEVDNGTFTEDTTICQYGWEYAPEYGEKSATTDGNYLVGYIRAVEMFTAKKRLLGHVCVQYFWSFGVILVAPLAYLFPNWRYFQLFTSLICLPVHVLMWFFTYESLRWLVQKGWLDKAEAVLRKIAKSKNIKHDGSFLIKRELEGVRLVWKMELSEKSNHDRASDLQHESVTADVGETNQELMNEEKMETFTKPGEKEQTKSNKKKKYTVLDLFKTKVLIKHICIVFCLWYVMNATYNACSLVFMLPETKNKPLPETYEDASKLSKD
ncbi:uncharacterized protein LOC119719688 [Patiria miniata]|uniref:Uncharacterized protein n=1 Tax=Patiria miniata TaxID=46514 RepID=A0A913Z0C0_PATMI|nr:uncharacterized protein LOC119719688 [Patiria miniata]